MPATVNSTITHAAYQGWMNGEQITAAPNASASLVSGSIGRRVTMIQTTQAAITTRNRMLTICRGTLPG